MQIPNKFHYFLQQVIPSSHQRTQVLHWLALVYQGKLKDKKALVIYGPGGSGKSVFLNIIAEVMNHEEYTVVHHIRNLQEMVRPITSHKVICLDGIDNWKTICDECMKPKLRHPYLLDEFKPITVTPIVARQMNPHTHHYIQHFTKPKYPNPSILEELKAEVPAIRKYLLAVHPFQVGDLVYVLGRAPAILLKINHRNYHIRYLRDSYRVRHNLPNGRIYHADDIFKVKSIAHIPTNPKYAVSPSERVMYYQLKAVMK